MISPFKFLDSYTKADRKIFFGREREIEELYQRVFESKTLLVYGVSGTGKSSLIHCGLESKFNERDWLPIAVRRSENILNSLESEIKKASLTHFPEELKSPAQFRKAVRSLYVDQYIPIFFIFDQFEELFINGSKEEIQAFSRTVKILTDSEIQCRFIFVIREEYIAGMTELEKFIPAIFQNRIRIEKMSHLNALEAIKGPCQVSDIGFEEGFPEALLEKLSPEGIDVELTYLQVFLDKIFRIANAEKPDDASGLSFTSEFLEKSGDVTDLLGSFLDDQISLLDDPDAGLIVLKSFVSVKGTKKQMNWEEVSDYALTLGKPLNQSDLLELLETFTHLRILRDKDLNGRYELRHDALALKIYEKITLVEKEILEIRQLIENSWDSWQKRRVLISKADLDYIAPYESRLYLSKDFESLIDRSKKELIKAKQRRRNFVTVIGVVFCVVLSFFTWWALSEREKSLSRERETMVKHIIGISNKEAQYYPTRSFILSKYALSLDPDNEELRENMLKFYYGDNLSKTIFSSFTSFPLFYAAISPDKNNIVVNAGSGLILLDNNGRIKRVLDLGAQGKYLTFLPDGNTFLSVEEASVVKLYDLNGRVLQRYVSRLNKIKSIALSNDGSKMLTGTTEGTLQLSKLDGNVLFELKGYNRSGRFSPKGNSVLAISIDGSVTLLDLDGKIIRKFNVNNEYKATAAAFSPDGNTILAGLDDNSMIIWDLNGRVIKIYRKFDFKITNVNFLPGENKVMISTAGSLGCLYDLDNNTLQYLKEHSSFINYLGYWPETKILLTWSNDGIKKWFIQEDQTRVFQYGVSGILTFDLSPDGTKVVIGENNPPPTLWDLNDNRLAVLKGHDGFIGSVAFSPDGTKILTGGYDDTPKLWDLHGNLIREFKGHTMLNYSVGFTHNSNQVLTGSWDKTVRLWNMDGKTVTIYRGHTKQVGQVVLSPDGTKVIASSDDMTVTMWDINGKLIRTYRVPGYLTEAIAFSNDGQKIAAGLYGGIIVWDMQGNELHRFEGPKYYIKRIRFSNDDKRIYTAGKNEVREWDMKGNTTRIFIHTNAVWELKVLNDGNIMTGCLDNTIRKWGYKLPLDSFLKRDFLPSLDVDLMLENGLIKDADEIKTRNSVDYLSAARWYMNKADQEFDRKEKMSLYKKAEELLKKIRKNDPEYWETCRLLSTLGLKEYMIDKITRTDVIEHCFDVLNRSDDPLEIYKSIIHYSSNVNEMDSSQLTKGYPDKVLALTKKLQKINQTSEKAIAEYLALYARGLFTNSFFIESLKVALAAMEYDPENEKIIQQLPFLYLMNDQYDKAEEIIMKWKDRRWTKNAYFETFGEAFRHILRGIGDFDIDEETLRKINELLKDYPLRYVG